MPRCFMAKKLKYPYEQWKEEQKRQSDDSGHSSRSPSPPPPAEDLTVKRERPDVDLCSPEPLAAFSPPAAHLLAAHFTHYGFFAAAAAAAAAPAPLPAHRNSTSSLTPPPEHQQHTPSPQREKKDIFRPYCLEDPRPSSSSAHYYPYPSPYLQYRNIEDINTAHAILDLSRRSSRSTSPQEASPSGSLVSPSSHVPSSSASTTVTSITPTPLLSPALSTTSSLKENKAEAKTTAYTYEAFFASDGRSKKRPVVTSGDAVIAVQPSTKARYSCTECGKNYATSSNLSRHKQTHRSLDSNNAKKCHICGKMYVSMPALSMHILTHNLSHKCNVCGKAFSRPWLLQGHMRSHSGDKPYGCAHCGKSFADRSNLRAHMQTHSAFKNFKCKRCNKSFALKSYLNKHYESACFKDQPIPAIDTPPCTPAPSELSDGLISPGASSSIGGDSLSAPFSPASSISSSPPNSISSLLLPAPPLGVHHQQLVRV